MALSPEVLAGFQVQARAHPHVLLVDLFVEDIKQPGEPPGAAFHHHELKIAVTHQDATGNQQGYRALTVGHRHGHEIKRAADAIFLAPIFGILVLAIGESMEGKNNSVGLESRPQGLVVGMVIGPLRHGDRNLDGAIAQLGDALDFLDRGLDIDDGQDCHRREAIGMLAENIHAPVVIGLGHGKLIAVVARVIKMQSAVGVDHFGDDPVPGLIRQAPVDIAAAGGIVAEFTALIFLALAFLGDVQPPRTFAIDNTVEGAVDLLGARC